MQLILSRKKERIFVAVDDFLHLPENLFVKMIYDFSWNSSFSVWSCRVVSPKTPLFSNSFYCTFFAHCEFRYTKIQLLSHRKFLLDVEIPANLGLIAYSSVAPAGFFHSLFLVNYKITLRKCTKCTYVR